MTNMCISTLRRSVSEARRWFSATKLFWIWLALTVAILVFFYFLPGSSLQSRVRWAGALFEFLGISAVVISINRARRSFGRSSVLRGMWIRLKEFRFIFVRRPPINVTLNETLQPFDTFFSATVTNSLPSTTEERVAELERKFTRLEKSVGNLDQRIVDQGRELRAAIKSEIAQREAGDRAVGDRLEEGLIGDSYLELAGVSYLFLGVIMANLPAEVAVGLGWIGLT